MIENEDDEWRTTRWDWIRRKIKGGNACLYRRVSKKDQSRSGFPRQLKDVQEVWEEFRVQPHTAVSFKEAISGLAEMDKRARGEFGKAISFLKHNSNTILLVSDPDRIGRTVEVFEKVSSQGLGGRIFAASNMMSVTEMMQCGLHHRIECASRRFKDQKIAGQRAYKENGGVLGNPNVGRQSRKASRVCQRKRRKLESKVMYIIRYTAALVSPNEPSYQQICSELVRRGVRTGQDREFTASRLTNFIRTGRNPGAFRSAKRHWIDKHPWMRSSYSPRRGKPDFRSIRCQVLIHRVFMRTVLTDRCNVADCRIPVMWAFSQGSTLLALYRTINFGCRGPPCWAGTTSVIS